MTPTLGAAFILQGPNQILARRLNGRLQEFIQRIEHLPAPVGIREAASLRNMKAGPHAAPLGEQGLKTFYEFREWFKGWLPIVLQEAAGE